MMTRSLSWLLLPALVAAAPAPIRLLPDAAVTSLALSSGGGTARLAISVSGTVSVKESTLPDPARLVLDVQGAKVSDLGRYDGLLVALRAEPFDLAAVNAAMSAIVARNAERLTKGQDLLAARIKAMSPADRLAFADRLINHMGFEALDVASMIAPAVNLPLFEENLPHPSVEWSEIATTFIAISPTPELQGAAGVSVVEVGGAPQVVVTGHISAELEGLMLVQVRGAKKLEQVREKVAEHNALVAAQQAPASRGEPFAPVPTLGYRTQAQAPLWPLEREAVLETVELDLMTPQAIQLPGFQVVAQSNTFASPTARSEAWSPSPLPVVASTYPTCRA